MHGLVCSAEWLGHIERMENDRGAKRMYEESVGNH